MVDKEEQGWGLAQYSGKVSVSFAYEGQQHTHEFRITRSKLGLFAAHWEFVIPGRDTASSSADATSQDGTRR